MMLTKLLNPIYLYLVTLIHRWKANRQKKRSEYALSKLSDHLLDDIGMRRIDEEIVPINKSSSKITEIQRESNQISRKRLLARKRLRHPYLIGRRQE
ncbi:MAG: DUF1127 domain-containing protein [Cellvibrionaceae bacterium]